MIEPITPNRQNQSASGEVMQTRAAPPRRGHRFRRILLWTASLLAIAATIVAAVLYRRYTSSERIIELVRDQLRVLPCPASVSAADFTFFGGLHIQGLSVGPCGEMPLADSVEVSKTAASLTSQPSTVSLRCRELRLVHNPLPLLLGRIQINRVIAVEPSIDLIGDVKHATTPLLSLADRLRADPKGRRSLPSIELQDAKLRVFDRSGDTTNLLEELPISLRAMVTAPAQEVYDVTWQSSSGQAGHAQIDIKAGRLRGIRGGSPSVSIQAAIAALSPPYGATNHWCELAEVAGRVRLRDFDVDLHSLSEKPGTVVLELRDGAVALPVDQTEQELSAGERFMQLAGIRGAVSLGTDKLHAALHATLHGRPVEFEASVPNFISALRQAGIPAFHLAVSVNAFPVRPFAELSPRELRAIDAEPVVGELYRELDPTGFVNVRVVVSHDGKAPKPLVEQVLVEAKSGRATPKVFPYPVDDISGRVDVQPNRVTVESVCGRHGDGVVCVNGGFEGRKSCSPGELVITGKHVPIDNDLYAALGPKLSKIHDYFAPRGAIDVRTVTRRPACENGEKRPWQTSSTVHLDNVEARYRGLPYEFINLTGTVEVDTSAVALNLAGHTGNSPISASGNFVLNDGETGPIKLYLDVKELPIDSRMFEAMGGRAAARLRPWRLQGGLNAQAEVGYDPKSEKLTYSSSVQITDASLNHEEYAFPITGITGELEVDPQRIRIVQLVGRHDDAQFSAEGRLPPPDAALDGSDEIDLSIDVLDLRPDAEFVAAAPAGIQQALAQWRIDGPLSGHVQITGKPQPDTGLALSYAAEVRFAGVSVQHSEMPAPFTDVHGMLSFNQESLHAEDLRGRYGRAAVRAGIQAYFASDAQHGSVNLAATGIRLDDELFAAMPGSMAPSLRRLRPAGYLDADLERLQFTRSQGKPMEWTGAGLLRLHSVDLPALSLAGVSGDLTFSGVLNNPKEGTMLAGELHIDRALAFDRELTRIDSPWSFIRSAEGFGELTLERVRAELYGGEVSGRAEVGFDPRSAEYNLTAIAQNLQLQPFLNAGRPSSAPSVEASGTLSANLFLSGESGNPQSLRGGGRFEVLNGDLYKLPVILAILNVLELTARPTDTFEEAAADFIIAGRQATIRDIALRGGVLALVGSGTLVLPDFAVDLRLVNVPDQWWARLPVVAEVMQGAVRELAQVRVTGPLSQPTVRTEPIPRLTEELRALFQRRASKKPIAPGKK